MKQMTCKEFKQILNESGMSFECFGWEGILNALSGWNRQCAKDMRSHGLNAGADKLQEEADAMYDALDARGYYDEARRA